MVSTSSPEPVPAELPEAAAPLGELADVEDARHHLRWRRTFVDDRPVVYGVAGEGLPVVFVHGWGLGHHAYKRSLKRLARMGARVYAPALPGFGGTAELPRRNFSLAGYAEWLDGFLGSVKLDEPVVLVGHSFGGGVSIKFAHDYPDRVRSLILVNSIGGSAWQSGKVVKSMAERPLWDWGIHFPSDVLPFGQITRVLPVVLEDAVPNLIRNPKAVWDVAHLARKADLTAELEELKRRQLPVVVLWGAGDKIIPRESFEALCRAVGTEGEVIDGNHSWLLADPDAFGEVMTNMVAVAHLARELEQEEGRPARRRRGLLGLARSRPRSVGDLRGAAPADER